MRKRLMLALTSLILLSCNNDNESDNNKNSLNGTWHPYEWGVKSGKDGSKIQWELNDDCEKKTSTQFKSDGTTSEHHFQPKANGTCEDQGIKNGTYTYNESTSELIINIANSTYKYKVILLNENELHLDVFANYDMNGDGINDPHIKVFRK